MRAKCLLPPNNMSFLFKEDKREIVSAMRDNLI
jgi:hypothetical protein